MIFDIYDIQSEILRVALYILVDTEINQCSSMIKMTIIPLPH